MKEQFLRVQSAGRRCWKGRRWEGRSCDGESLPVARAGEGEGTMVLIEISFSKTTSFKQKKTRFKPEGFYCPALAVVHRNETSFCERNGLHMTLLVAIVVCGEARSPSLSGIL